VNPCEWRPSGEANIAHPDSTGASRFDTLYDATGPKSKVTGESRKAGANQLVFDIALTPPSRAQMALVKKGL